MSIKARAEDIISLSEYRLSREAKEEILLEHPDLTDCTVVGVKEEHKGEVPFGFVATPRKRLGGKCEEDAGHTHEPKKNLRREGPAKNALGEGAPRNNAEDCQRGGVRGDSDDQGPQCFHRFDTGDFESSEWFFHFVSFGLAVDTGIGSFNVLN